MSGSRAPARRAARALSLLLDFDFLGYLWLFEFLCRFGLLRDLGLFRLRGLFGLQLRWQRLDWLLDLWNLGAVSADRLDSRSKFGFARWWLQLLINLELRLLGSYTLAVSKQIRQSFFFEAGKFFLGQLFLDLFRARAAVISAPTSSVFLS